MSFWIITLLLALSVSLLLALALLRGSRMRSASDSEGYDVQVYRDQLAEVERDLARGVIGPEDAERVRTEVSRRILAADAEKRGARTASEAAPTLSWAMAAVLVAVVVAGSFFLYRDLGAPGYGDLSLERRVAMAEELRASRPDQATAEASVPDQPAPANLTEEYKNLVAELRETVASRPDDLTGQSLLARHEAASGNFEAAYAAQKRVIALKGEDAGSEDFTYLADMLILAAGGYVSPEAEDALEKALSLAPRNGAAQYYWGLMMVQTGRPDQAFRIWNSLLRQSPADAPWIPPIREQITRVAREAGVNFTMPPEPQTGGTQLRGPSAEDVEATRDMTPEDRQAMIEGMVQGLAARLADEGGPPEEWARLISALGVLGDLDQARAIYDNARSAFAGEDAALAQIEAAANRAGIAE